MTKEDALEVFSTVKERSEHFKECGCRFPLWTITERDEEAIGVAIETLQAEPIVRCKDCDRGFGSPVCPIQSKGWAINKDTFFCAWGERREP